MHTHKLVLKKASALSLSSSRIYGLYKLSPSLASVSVQKFSRCILPLLLPSPCFASCNCCHDPFIVRSAQPCPPFTGFTQLAHPSRCSRSTLTTVCFCALVSVITSGLCVDMGSLCSCRVSVFISGLQLHHQIHHRLVTFILLCGVGSMVSRIPILQTCKVVVGLKQRLASLQHLHKFSL